MNIDKDEIVTSIEAATDFDQLRVLFDEDCKWECQEDDILPSIDKAIGLVTTFEQGALLQSKLKVDDEPWHRVVSKMIGLAENDDDLNQFIYNYYEYEILERRDMIRKVFNRADELAI